MKKLLKIVLYLFLGLVVLVVILGRTEKFKFRYQPDELIRLIQDTTQLTPFFARDSSRGDGLHYLQLGNDPAKPYLVFIHGSPGALNAYNLYFSDTSLIAKANLISIDRYGFGYSQFGKAEPSLQKQAEGVFGVLQQLKNDRIILVGHSYGGPVIARTGMDYPEKVKGLIMVAPSISPQYEPGNAWRKVVNFPLWSWITPPVLNVSNREILPLKEELEKMMGGWKMLTCPVVVIQGSEDDLVPMENALFAEEMMPDNPLYRTIMLDKEDHFILWTRAEVVKNEILDMLEKL